LPNTVKVAQGQFPRRNTRETKRWHFGASSCTAGVFARNVHVMRQQDRLGLILERLNSQSSVSVPELAVALEVSQASVRRDLQLLESQQLLSRTHGGAVASGVLYELPMRYRGGQRHEAKRAIAKVAVQLLGPEVSSVGLNGGSTTTEVARALAARSGLRVVTNALNIASELAVRSNIDLVVCGGSARAESYELVGPLAEMTLANLNIEVAIIGVDGVNITAGLTTHHEVEAQTNRCLLRAAERVIVVADSSKIGRRGFARISEIGVVSDLVTDSDVKDSDVAELERAGLKVHLAEV
jgi:DeoR family transcriptional regulator, aga operon transcriptional repressor